MKYRFSHPWLRVLALLLAALCMAGVFFYGITALICVNYGFFYDEPVYQITWSCAQSVRNQGRDVIDQFRRNPEFRYWDKLLENSNLRFIILEEQTGDVKASYLEGLDLEVPENLADNMFLYQYDPVMSKGEYGTVLENYYVCDYYFGDNWAGESSYGQMQEEMQWENRDTYYTVDTPMVAVAEPESAVTYQILYLLGDSIDAYCGDVIGSGYRLFLYFRDVSQNVLSQFLVSALPLLLLLIYLLVTAGRKPGEEAVALNWFDRIPTDLMLAVGILAGVGIVGTANVLWDATNFNSNITISELRLVQNTTTVGAAICGSVILLILCSFSARIKAGVFWKSALTFRAFRWCWKLIRRGFFWGRDKMLLGIRSVGMVPRAVLVTLGVFFVEFLLLVWLVNAWEPAFPVMALLLFNLVVLFAVIWGIAQMKILQKAAAALADGDLDSHLDTGHMYWDFKRHGEHLNAIAGGLNKAVEQRMKSERLKTELITNVSHDIKTPLTSIVNYVDLLQKPHTEAEGIQYLEVLDRQAKRLKKLTENLVEASKASAGNLPVELQPTSVLELLNQAVEEYRERLEAGKLEIVMALRGDLTVLADGKHMWRILDNLLNNVVKYALAGTRVYVTAEKRNEWVVIAVKNISRDPLNVSADELMERFVRGDSSRTTEGSGLGLNIARSLTVLQNGTFDLTVDGDFFKAEISLPAV